MLAGALGVPPVDQPDAVEVAVRALLQVGDVLVVDAEYPLAQRLVRVVEQRQHGVGECQLLVDAVLGELADARLDVVGRRAGQVVVLHEHPAEVTAHQDLPFMPTMYAPSSYQMRGAWPLRSSGNCS